MAPLTGTVRVQMEEFVQWAVRRAAQEGVLNLWMSNKTKGIGINWYENPDADKYTIYKKIGNNGSWKKLTTVSNKKLRFVDKKVKKGTKYSYKIQASYKNNTSPMSKIKSIIRK